MKTAAKAFHYTMK